MGKDVDVRVGGPSKRPGGSPSSEQGQTRTTPPAHGHELQSRSLAQPLNDIERYKDAAGRTVVRRASTQQGEQLTLAAHADIDDAPSLPSHADGIAHVERNVRIG